jgi:hypothetical protein
MISYICTWRHRYPLMDFLYSAGKACRRHVHVLTYESVLRRRHFRTGTVIFADLERLTPPDLEAAARLARQLRNTGVRVLNDPGVSCRRYELLRRLHDRGINPYNVSLLSEGRCPEHFPVFIRRANDHGGSMTELLTNRNEFEAACQQLHADNCCRDDKLVVEFQDTRSNDGWYRKYAALRVGQQVVARHLLLGHHWVLKDALQNMSPEMAEEEWRYVRDNPHAQMLMPIFELAGIDYGRIDYGLYNGQPVIWEINTNPAVCSLNLSTPELRVRQQELFVEHIRNAFAAIDDSPPAKVRVRRPIPVTEWASGAEQWLALHWPQLHPLMERLTKPVKPFLKRCGMARKPQAGEVRKS